MSRARLLGLTAIALLTLVAQLVAPPTAGLTGLRGSFRDPSRGGARLISRVPTSLPSTESLHDALPGPWNTSFDAIWTGWVVVLERGIHRFAMLSDGRAKLWVGERLVIDQVASGPPARSIGKIPLARGVYSYRVEHEHPPGDVTLHVAWQRPGRSFEALSALATRFRPVEPSWREEQRGELGRLLRLAASAVWVVAILIGAAAGVGASVRRVTAADAQRLSRSADPLLAPVLVLAFGLSLWGIEWGLPAAYAWAPDEITPSRLLEALSARFSGGWHDLYPPLQFYVLTGVTAPVVAGASAGWYSMDTLPAVTLVYVAMRAVSVLMATGVVLFVYLTAREVLDAPRAAIGALLACLSLPFLYYAKTANVEMPYLFWVAMSFWFFVRYVRHARRFDALALAAAAAAAVCTKDQAYGFYVLMPIALIASNVWHRRQRGEGSPLMRGVLDPTFLLALLLFCAIVAAVYLLPWNASGLRAHIAFLGRRTYPPMVEPGLSGQLTLVRLMMGQLAWSVGWPAFLLTLAGVGHALWQRPNVALLSLLVPVLSYHVTFLAIIRYSYDRFLIGSWLILAIFGGALAGAAWQSRARWATPARWAVVAVAVYSLLYAVTVNVMMGLDARYGVERYLREHAPPFAAVYVAVPGESGNHLPRVDAYRGRRLDVEHVGLGTDRPEFIIVDTLRRSRFMTSAKGQALIAGLETGALGYRPVARGRTPLPWWALAGRTHWLSTTAESGETNLEKVNPPVVLFEMRGLQYAPPTPEVASSAPKSARSGQKHGLAWRGGR
jgi:Dolichyl-phosphate-mannose-protein mannosyltransferase/PA14 domain